MTSKERAGLRSKAQSLDTIFFVGKSGLTDEIVKQLDNAINARELIKVGVQENCELSAREAADLIAPRLRVDVVAVIGRKFVLWRKSEKPKAVSKKQEIKPLYKVKAGARVGAKVRNDSRSGSRSDSLNFSKGGTTGNSRGKTIRNIRKGTKKS